MILTISKSSYGGDVFKSLLLGIISFLYLSCISHAQTISFESDRQKELSSGNSTTDDDSPLPRILIDEIFDDWNIFPNLVPATTGTDPESVLKVINDKDILYIYFEVDSMVSLQNNNSLTLFIDSDDNPKTGKSVNGIGADIEYRFGERAGTIYTSNKMDTIGAGSLFLIISPTVWSDKYEITIDLHSAIENQKLFDHKRIRLLIKDTSSGESIPSAKGGTKYTLSDYNFAPLKPYSLTKQSADLIRVISHNVEFSGFFRKDRKEAYRRLYQAIQPDIIGFSELYQDYKLEDVTTRLE